MIRKPLGRGLGALIEDAGGAGDGAAPPSPMMVAIDQIAPSPFQPRSRFDPERLEELTRAIERQGIIEPLIVRQRSGAAAGSGFELIAGERRLRAARNASLTQVPVIVRELDDRAALEMSLVENLAREDLSAIDEARAFHQLSRQFSLSHDEIAVRIAKSRPYVSNTIRLLELSPAVLAMLESGELNAGQARPLLALSSEPEQVDAAHRIVEGQLSARGAERIAALQRKPSAKAQISAVRHRDPNLGAIASQLQRSLKRKVRIFHARGRKGGRVELEFYDDNDLTALVRTLSLASLPRLAPAAL